MAGRGCSEIREAENQIITHHNVFDKRPSDGELLRTSAHWNGCQSWSQRMLAVHEKG
jgi:hypothetical protein